MGAITHILLTVITLTVETAKQLIHNGYFYIDIIEEQIRHGYNVKANQSVLLSTNVK